MSLTTTISTFANLKPFRGSSAHEWLIFLRAFTLCLNNAGISSIILEGTDITGHDYLSLVDMKTQNSVEAIFIDFYNSKIEKIEASSRTNIEKECQLCSPWVFYIFAPEAHQNTLIDPGSLLPGTSIPVQVPTVEALRNFAADVGLSAEWVTSRAEYLELVQEHSTALERQAALKPGPMHQAKLIDHIHRNYMSVKYLNPVKLRQRIDVVQQQQRLALGDPILVLDLEDCIPLILHAEAFPEHEYKYFIKTRQEHSGKTADRMKSTQADCHAAFAYVGDISTINGAANLLQQNKFYGCFQAINDHFMQLGISNIARFETEARAYTLQFGQDVSHHIENVKAAILRWVLMELLELDMKGPLINIAGSIPRNATQRILSLLSKDEVCSMNSFDVEDYRIKSAGFPVILTEHKRFELYLRSISASSSHRFKTVVDHFSISDPKVRTVVNLMGMLQNAEQSMNGQHLKATERAKHKDWETNLHHYLAGLQGDSYVPPADLLVENVKIGTSNPKVTAAQAHVAFAGDTSVQPHLVCLNPRHKSVFNHISNDCKSEPWRSMWLTGKLSAITGLPLDGSLLPTRKASKALLAATQPAPSAAGASSKPPKKERYTGPPCSFCSSKPDLQKCAPTHDISTCKIQANYDKRRSSSSSSGHVATSSSDSSMVANVAQLSQSMLQLTKLLTGQKRKADAEEMDQST